MGFAIGVGCRGSVRLGSELKNLIKCKNQCTQEQVLITLDLRCRFAAYMERNSSGTGRPRRCIAREHVSGTEAAPISGPGSQPRG